jgi:HAD superfamily hydrolase (TIGR01484 family)
MNKKLIAFDLDETLAESKQPIDMEMAQLLKKLLYTKQVAIISGGRFEVIKKNLLDVLEKVQDVNYNNLLILPNCGSRMHKYDGNWKKIYAHDFSSEEKNTIIFHLNEALKIYNLHDLECHGERIEDRESQITYSAFGQLAPLHIKKDWDNDCVKRLPVIKYMTEKSYDQYGIKAGGSSSIDITKKGLDKAYGIKQLMAELNLLMDEILFIGDKMSPGGNDYPVKQLGVDSIETKGPTHSKKIIEEFILLNDGAIYLVKSVENVP